MLYLIELRETSSHCCVGTRKEIRQRLVARAGDDHKNKTIDDLRDLQPETVTGTILYGDDDEALKAFNDPKRWLFNGAKSARGVLHLALINRGIECDI